MLSLHFIVMKILLLSADCVCINPWTPNDYYSGRTAPLTSKRCILYIYSTNIGTGYFKHGINSPFFSLQNAVCFIILIYLVPVLFTFYLQGVLRYKKNNSGAKRLNLSKVHAEFSSPPSLYLFTYKQYSPYFTCLSSPAS